MVVLVVFPLLARPAPVSTKYHTIAGILDATVTLCRQSLPAARPQPFLVLSVYSPSIQASLRAAASRPNARLDACRPSAGRPFAIFFEVATSMPKELFGTDGIRGVPGTPPLDDATLYATGRALGTYLKQTSPAAHVLIGMDTRESGPHIAALLAAGLANAGVLVDFAGIITTPGVACLVRQRGFQAGVVISASHNPFHDNGVKLFSGAGMKFPDAVEETLEEDILKHRQEPAPKNPPALVADESLDARYLDFLRSRVLPGAKLSSLRMVLDCANGAAYKLGTELFESLGEHVIAIGAEPDGRNINADCGSLHLEGLQKRVVAERAGLGIAFDGDADRAMFVCQSGRVVNGDGVLLAAARHLKSAGKLKGNRVVATSMSNLGLERILAREGIELGRAAVGDRYVLEEMLRSNNARSEERRVGKEG